MNINQIIEKIPGQAPKKNQILRENAENILKQEPNNTDACRIIKAIEDFESSLKNIPAAISSTTSGKIEWESHQHKTLSYGYSNGKKVARIQKNENHTNNSKKVYSLFVLGEEVPCCLDKIRDVRILGEERYCELDSML